MTAILRAVMFAAEKHARQRRKDPAGTPYINHPIAVANLLTEIGGVTDTDVLIAALLHDTIEDTDTTADEIKAAFGETVTKYVLECTDDKTLKKEERKRLQVVNAPHKSAGAAQIKLADKSHNLNSILDAPPKDWNVKRQLEYFRWAQQVIEGLRGHNAAMEEHVDTIIEKGIAKLT